MDWRWALAAVPIGVAMGGLLLWRIRTCPPFRGLAGRGLAVLYALWATVLEAVVLQRAARRIQIANGGGGNWIWILLLIAAPLLWVGLRKGNAFFRAVGPFWPATAVLLVGLLLVSLPQIEWRWLVLPAGDGRQTALAMTLVLSTGVFILPYIYKVEERLGRGLLWQGGAGVLAVGLAAVTTGLLSPAVADAMEVPFFMAVGVSGESVRAEGLVSALWLLPDLTLAGLLAKTWGEGRGTLATAAACLLAIVGIPGYLSLEIMALGTVVLTVITLVLPGGKAK